METFKKTLKKLSESEVYFTDSHFNNNISSWIVYSLYSAFHAFQIISNKHKIIWKRKLVTIRDQ